MSPKNLNLPQPPKGDRGYAILVDADGADPEIAGVMVDALVALGAVPIRRLHGNLHGQDIGKSWEKLARAKGFERLHRPRATETKNGADVALVVDAMDLMAQGIRFFCLVAGDTDYGPLVERLHRANRTTVIVAANPALHAWSPHAFTYADIRGSSKPSAMQQGNASAKAPSAPSSAAASKTAVPPPVTSIESLLRGGIAFAHGKNKSADGWVDTEWLGSILPQVDPDYSRKKYGLTKNTTVRSMALRYPEAFELQSRTIKDIPHHFVRARV